MSAAGANFYKSLEIQDATAGNKTSIANPFANRFRPEVSGYLSNSLYTGNSAKAWYLVAAPSDPPVIEVAFVSGQEPPTIETPEADLNVLGIQMPGYHGFCVNLQDPSAPRMEEVPFSWRRGGIETV